VTPYTGLIRAKKYATLSAAVVLLAGCATSQEKRPATASAAPADAPQSKVEATAEAAVGIATQPARDLGVAKTSTPAVLLRAAENPYALDATANCSQVAAAIAGLTEHLGPDYTLGMDKDENKAGKLAEAGGKTIINAIIPFRGLVREMTGAAAAQRRLNDAVDAGYARRGFLRGIQMVRACRKAPVVRGGAR
jgi:hypothetical protein